MRPEVAELLAQWIASQLEGAETPPALLCAGRPELLGELEEAIAAYRRLHAALRREPGPATPAPPPELPGFRVVERIGGGGGGEVYKLEDLQLGRMVAAKVLRRDGALGADLGDFLEEARSLALFDDPAVVRLFELRDDHEPPVLLMEYVDGFELQTIGPSLEHRQRARILAEVADAVQRAHDKGVQHRDLKPSNILVDRELKPRILDLGLSSRGGDRGHGRGTLAYMAPEQLRPGEPIDHRSDVYALGVVLYQLLCGAPPYTGDDEPALLQEILEARPRLPLEIDASVPQALQAVALKAMARDPAQRYPSAREMAADLRRFLTGRPVLARPPAFHEALETRIHAHLEQLREWLRLRLIYPHEAERLERDYRRLEAREDDWIVLGRRLSWSQISLYLGAFLLLVGSLFFFTGYVSEAFTGWIRPFLTLGLPVIGLNATAFALLARQRRAVAVAFLLAATVLLPLTLLIVLREGGLLTAGSAQDQLIGDGWLSNRQLQAAFLVASGWSLWLALRTRTAALATATVALVSLLHLALLGEVGLRRWVEEGRWDLVALGLTPLLVLELGGGVAAERRRLPFLASPLLYAAAGFLVTVLELLALDGRALAHLGISLAALEPAELSSPDLLETVVAMTANGLLVYLAAWVADRHGSPLQQGPALMLFIVSPFAILEPLLVLNASGEYSIRFAWLYLGLALAIALASHFRQRKSFYLAGLTNTGVALWQITDRNQWFERPWWATTVIAVGLAVLAVGWHLDHRERRGE